VIRLNSLHDDGGQFKPPSKLSVSDNADFCALDGDDIGHPDVGGRVPKVGTLADAWSDYRVGYVKSDRLLVDFINKFIQSLIASGRVAENYTYLESRSVF
jgi:hypothetical protein